MKNHLYKPDRDLSGLERLTGLMLCLLVTTAPCAMADTATMALSIQGNIIGPTCNVVAGSNNQTVNMGDIGAATFSAVGARSTPKSFDIQVTGCSESIAGSTVTFSGTHDVTDNTLLGIDSSHPSTSASGVGIEITDVQTGAPLPLGSTSAQHALHGGDNTLSFELRYKATALPVTSGTANAVMYFDLQYQ